MKSGPDSSSSSCGDGGGCKVMWTSSSRSTPSAPTLTAALLNVSSALLSLLPSGLADKVENSKWLSPSFTLTSSCDGDWWPGEVWAGKFWSGLVWLGLAWSCVVRSGPVWSGLVWSDLVWSGPFRSSQIWSGLNCSGPVQSDLVQSSPVWSGLVWSGLVLSGPVRSSPVQSVLSFIAVIQPCCSFTVVHAGLRWPQRCWSFCLHWSIHVNLIWIISQFILNLTKNSHLPKNLFHVWHKGTFWTTKVLLCHNLVSCSQKLTSLA